MNVARVSCVVAVLCLGGLAIGQRAFADVQFPTPSLADATQDPQAAKPDNKPSGFALPDSDRLRVSFDLLFGYGYDGANATLGFEKQGRIGYAIFTASGKLNNRVSYLFSANPVEESTPLPSCGDPGFFYPNDPTFLYGAATTISCDPKNGNRRVDAYRGIALDVVPQQGPVREAYMDVKVSNHVNARFGRSRLPIGFDWQEAGSFSAKDAPRIQRINAQNDFGGIVTYSQAAGPARVRPLYTATIAAHLGEGNRYWDYDYYYFEDGSLDANSGLTSLLAGSFSPSNAIQIVGSYQHGDTGSKVERLKSYWASKRNDDAVVFGASYEPIKGVRILGEHARYVWGPTATSAAMLFVDTTPITKSGSYVTTEVKHGVTRSLVAGGSMSFERIDRADSLVRFLADTNQYNVVEGKRDGMFVLRAFTDMGPRIRVGFYHTEDSNPFPWLSGISPVTGPHAFAMGKTNKWGVIARLSVK